MSGEYETPRELADAVNKKYSVRLSPQENLLLFKLLRTHNLVTYQCIENYLWSDLAMPMSARKIIQVLLSGLRDKIPELVVGNVPERGYLSRLDLPSGSNIKTD